MLGGVCAGLGRYFGVGPLLIRLLFIAITLAMGSGVFLYVVLWILIPDEGVQKSPVDELVTAGRDVIAEAKHLGSPTVE